MLHAISVVVVIDGTNSIGYCFSDEFCYQFAHMYIIDKIVFICS